MQVSYNLISKSDIYSIIPFLQMLKPDLCEEILQQRLDEMVEQNYQCVGVYHEQRLVGICGLWILTKYYVGKHIEPDNAIILPEYQNKNIGKGLMQWIYDFAKENGCIASELNCYIDNKKAQSFWENEGYEVIALHYQKTLK